MYPDVCCPRIDSPAHNAERSTFTTSQTNIALRFALFLNTSSLYSIYVSLPSAVFIYSQTIRFSFLHSTYCPLLQYRLCRNWEILTVVSIIQVSLYEILSHYKIFFQLSYEIQQTIVTVQPLASCYKHLAMQNHSVVA